MDKVLLNMSAPLMLHVLFLPSYSDFRSAFFKLISPWVKKKIFTVSIALYKKGHFNTKRVKKGYFKVRMDSVRRCIT